MFCRCAAAARHAAAPLRRASSAAAAPPSQARVAARMARIIVELGTIQLRKMRNVDVAIRCVKMREAFIRLGPAFVKIGQALSTRRDVLPPELCEELALLQDAMPDSLTGAEAMRVLEGELGAPVAALFHDLDDACEPVASASLGQVYRARLRACGSLVAVKVQRENVTDLLALDAVAVVKVMELLKMVWRSPTDFGGIADEIVGRIVDELDYEREARDAAAFKLRYGGDVHVPEVFQNYSTARVLTMSWVDGTKLDAWGREPSHGTAARRALVRSGVQCTVKQFFEDGFFHADPHPGNLLVDGDGGLAYLDFGKMGTMTDADRLGLMSLVVHFVNRDAPGLARDFVALGFVNDAPDAEPRLVDALNRTLASGPADRVEMFGSMRERHSFAGVLAFLREALPGGDDDLAFGLPPRFATFEVVSAAYPHVARGLLGDRSPASRTALLELILDARGKVRWARLNALAESAFAGSEPSEPLSEDDAAAPRAAGGGRDAVVAILRASDFLTSDAGASTRAGLVDDAAEFLTRVRGDDERRRRSTARRPLLDALRSPRCCARRRGPRRAAAQLAGASTARAAARAAALAPSAPRSRAADR
ncbi:hypothetical protein JL722_13716 [Aureococcus anophagefferens]|nr:hypothetical protein JL722_13716 [Aureococcus anophagefferens]